MHRLQVFAVVTAAVFLSGLALAYGQFEKSPQYEPRAVTVLVDQVHTDLNHAYGSWHLSNSERDRLNNAEKQLRDFAHKWEDHKFDKGQLDEAIGSIQHVLDNNRLEGRDRDAIDDDVTRLRNMREAYDHHEIR